MQKSAIRSIILAGLALAATGSAALANKVSATADSGAQIRAILDSEAVAQALGNQAIDSLHYKGMRDDVAQTWSVETATCTIRIALIPTSPQDSSTQNEGPVGITYQVEEPIKPCA